MATLSKINVNNKKWEMIERHRALRAELRKKAKSTTASDEERDAARLKLQKLPRNSCMTRGRNRCELTGRPRAYIRKFHLCRIKFREMALQGLLPGVIKASW